MHQANESVNDYCLRVTVLNAKQGAHIASSGSGKSGRRPPHKTTEAQKRVLLVEFERNPNPPATERERIARALNLERRIVKNWFSNQRAFRRKTRQGYPGCFLGRESSGSGSPCRSDGEWEGEVLDGRNAQVKILPLKKGSDPEMDVDDPKRSLVPAYPVLRTTTNAYPTFIPPVRQGDPPVKNSAPEVPHPWPGAPASAPLVYVPIANKPTICLRLAPPSVTFPRPYNLFEVHKNTSITLPRISEAPLSLSRYPESALRSSLSGNAGIVSVS